MPASCATCSKPNASAVCSKCKCTFYCNVGCQRKDWKLHKAKCKKMVGSKQKSIKANKKKKCALYRIEKVEEKGMGMIANRDIEIGTMILSEDPLIWLLSDTSYDLRTTDLKKFEKEFAKPLLQRFKSLTKEQQSKMNSLSFKHDGSVLDIFLNNCLTNEQQQFDGVYADIARVNHSCNANCAHWIEPKEKGFNARIIAIKPIKKNEEITINYLGWRPVVYKARSERLLNGWKISKCDCVWCTKKMRKKYDLQIAKYKKMDEDIPKIKDFGQKYAKCKEMVQLIEDSFDCNPQFMYRHCWDLTQSAMACMNGEELISNLLKTVKYKRLAHGKDTQIPKEVNDLIQQMPPNIQEQIRKKIKKL